MARALPSAWSRCDVHDVQWYGTSAACPSCSGDYQGVQAMYYPIVTPIPTELPPDLTNATFHITLNGAHCGSATCTTCDPMERMVDGLTVMECLERYEAEQRADWGSQYGFLVTASAAPRCTPAQKDAARSAWSAALRAKVKEAREKERRQIVCDDDRWEE